MNESHTTGRTGPAAPDLPSAPQREVAAAAPIPLGQPASQSPSSVPIQYPLAFLDYTLRTNQTNEVRLTKILTVALGGLAACGVLLASILSPAHTQTFLWGVLLVASTVAAVFFIAAVNRIIRGISPTTQDSESFFLTDRVVWYGEWERFAAAVNSHDLKQAAEAVLRENFAMAAVVNARQQIYKRAVRYVSWGGALLVVSYFVEIVLRIGSSP